MTATAPFASPSDVEAIWRPLTDAESVQAAGLLSEASGLVLEIPQVAARVTAGLVSDATLRSVVVRMVLRVLLNPQRLTQFSNTVDDVSRSGTFEAGLVPAGELVVSPNEFDRLMGRVGLAGAFSVLQPALLVVPDVDFGFPPGADLNKLYLLDPTD